ncbi:MAG: PA14 domain-containing protein, partial [Ginsengibacter sp.]
MIKTSKSLTHGFMVFSLLASILVVPGVGYAQSDSTAFGDSIFITNGLTGKVYLLPVPSTRKLPDFDTMKAVSIIYIDSINIPPRNWSSGFPGLHDRFEWFGIEYTGFFKPNEAGDYVFRLLSDDGSKLFIDDKLIIDNDGLHGA